VEELKVPTRRITVEVFRTDGARACGTMFHTESLYQTGSAGDIVDELNDERTFVPFHAGDPTAESYLLNKRHIVRVHVPDLTAADFRPDRADGTSHEVTCELLLDNGTRLTGRPVVETPVAASRLLDKFNHAPTFVPFVTDDGIDFVHTDRIVRILQHG
jgi:hypothetical protein